MPTYKIKSPDGRIVTLKGDSPPTEQELEQIFSSFNLNIRIIGDDYRGKEFTAKDICASRGIDIYYNKRDHGFSSTELKKRIKNARMEG